MVLTEEFQLPDESQVVLRILRERDLYTFSISELLQPEQKVTCLVAKASLDESTRWHRRMAFLLLEMFVSADSIKSFLLTVQVAFLL
ncbi:hypothetical protein Tco_0580077, partial [Tanacetum coccineum]